MPPRRTRWPEHHAGSAFFIGAEEALIDPRRTVQIGFHGPVGFLEQDDWSRQHYTIITLADFLDMGVERVAAEVRRIVGPIPRSTA